MNLLTGAEQLRAHPGQPVAGRRCDGADQLLPPSLVSPPWQRQLPAARAPRVEVGEAKLVLYAKVMRWAAALPEFPVAEQVEAEFGVHKATANRWLNSIAEAYAVERPRRCVGGRKPAPAAS